MAGERKGVEWGNGVCLGFYRVGCGGKEVEEVKVLRRGGEVGEEAGVLGRGERRDRGRVQEEGSGRYRVPEKGRGGERKRRVSGKGSGRGMEWGRERGRGRVSDRDCWTALNTWLSSSSLGPLKHLMGPITLGSFLGHFILFLCFLFSLCPLHDYHFRNCIFLIYKKK